MKDAVKEPNILRRIAKERQKTFTEAFRGRRQEKRKAKHKKRNEIRQGKQKKAKKFGRRQRSDRIN